MSFTPEMNRLSLDQAPPLAIPASFFLTAPVAILRYVLRGIQWQAGRIPAPAGKLCSATRAWSRRDS